MESSLVSSIHLHHFPFHSNKTATPDSVLSLPITSNSEITPIPPPGSTVIRITTPETPTHHPQADQSIPGRSLSPCVQTGTTRPQLILLQVLDAARHALRRSHHWLSLPRARRFLIGVRTAPGDRARPRASPPAVPPSPVVQTTSVLESASGSIVRIPLRNLRLTAFIIGNKKMLMIVTVLPICQSNTLD